MAASPVEQVRLFVGLRVPPGLQAAMVPPRDQVPGHWRWTAPERLHVTLVFIGNVPAAELAPIAAALQPLAACPPVHLVARGLAGFPHAHRARVLVRAVDLTAELAELQHLAVTCLAPWLGANRHETYRPHVTLARSKFGDSVPVLPLPELDWMAGEACLIESVRDRQGLAYVDRVRVTLGSVG